MQAHDDVVDTEAALEGEDLLGHFIRRADEEVVPDQILETLPQFVGGARPRAAETPGGIGLVLGLDRLPGETKGLFAGRRDENFAAEGEFLREGPARFVEGALIGLQLLFDRGQPVVRADVPAASHPRRAADRDIGTGADPDRRVRALHRLGRRRFRSAPG